MDSLTLYRCNTCGNLIQMIQDSGIIPICCGEQMELVRANSKEATMEKHVPVIEQNDRRIRIRIGSLPHPMTEEHHIEWIVLLTNKGMYMRELKISDYPECTFTIGEDEKVFAAYSYCNLHGLWNRIVEGCLP